MIRNIYNPLKQIIFMVQLSENEIRDIMKYLEKGKPLPDSYRFLLFDDNRQVELV